VYDTVQITDCVASGAGAMEILIAYSIGILAAAAAACLVYVEIDSNRPPPPL